MSEVDKLTEIGFEKIGMWELEGKDEIIYNLETNTDSEDILYSFVIEGNVKYIGKTTRELSRRMYGYQSPGPTQSTNIRLNHKIKTALNNKSKVEIFALPDDGLLHLGEFHVNLAAGLEDSLINTLQPGWNQLGIN